jgi:hypothetical protein
MTLQREHLLGAPRIVNLSVPHKRHKTLQRDHFVRLPLGRDDVGHTANDPDRQMLNQTIVFVAGETADDGTH